MHTLSIHPDYAQMDMQIKIFAEERMGVSINLLIHGEKEDYGKFYLEKGSHIYHYVFTVERPKLWWCHDQGYPHLYDYTLEISGRSVEQQWSDVFGIRTIELITEKSDSSDVGESFYFKLNGRPIFAKGANYIPQDVFPHRVAELQYGNLLQEAVNSNMNMLRVWGGGIYEKEIFYDLCDYKGILVWQDYMFACAMYPGDKKFIANVKAEAEEQSLRIGSHPCVALFCGNNEIAEGWARWGWKDPLKKVQIEKLQKAYDSIFEDVLRNATNNYTQCDYWPSSPMLGRGDPLHTTVGDAHYWGVWHDAEPFENFRKKVPRFMSEFGFQSYPSLQTLLKIDPVEENLFVGSEALANHQKHSRGDKLIADYMAQWLDAPTSFEKFLYQSQFVQAEGMRIGLDAHLAAWPYCGGTLYWQYNDCWPAVSWSSRDYYGNWKMMQYMVREAFKPLRVIAIPIDDKTTRVYIHNHSPFAQQVLFTAQYMGLNDAFSVQEGELSDIYCEAGKNTFVGDFVIESSENDTAAHYWLFELQSEFGNDRRIHLLEEIASYISAPNDYEVSFDKMGDTRIIKMSADKFEMGVWLECSGTGVFSDNYFNLIPGEEMGILFESEERDLNFTIRSLGGGIIRSFDEKDFRQVLPGE
jgi:beta-mannosidase